MKPPRVTGSPEAILGDAVNKLIRKFDYPDVDTVPPAFDFGGGGGMAHILIVSTSEPEFVQDKADYVVNETNAGPELNGIFATLPTGARWSIWMAGRFVIDEDVTFPSHSWVRGLGYTIPST